MALIVAIMASFMVFLDATIVTLALPTLGDQLGGGRAELEWVINAYTLTFAAIMLSAGSLADTFGARRLFVAGLTVFALTSGICGFAGSMPVLIVARLVQGAGAALLLPSSLALATNGVSQQHERGRIVAVWAAAGGSGLAAGPLIGGLVVDGIGWRWVFWINVFIGAAAVVATLTRTAVVPAKPKRLDVGGQVGATLGIAGLVFFLIEGPSLGWGSVPVVAAAVAFVVGAVGFFAIERSAAEPILPLRLGRNPDFTGSAALGALFNFTFYGVMFALSLLLQQVKGESATFAGLSFLPLTGLIAIGNLVAPRLAARRTSNFVLFLGQALFGVGLLASLFTGVLEPAWPLLIALLPAGFGAGLLVPTMTSRLLETAAPHLAGAASGAFNTSRQVGGAIGVAAFGPLLGTGAALTDGFQLCLALAVVAVAASVLITATALRRRSVSRQPAAA